MPSSRPIRTLHALLAGTALLLASTGHAGPKVKLQTSLGDLVIELDSERAPISSANFLEYVDSGFYDGTLFHRVIPGFMVQGGGFDANYQRKPTRDPIKNEADNGLQNVQYSVAMARTQAPHSATAQFFINNVDNSFLDHRSPTPRGWGYAVFGRVVDGEDVVEAISGVPTGSAGPFAKDAPQQPVLIESAVRVAE